jgi:hypothetical protein
MRWNFNLLKIRSFSPDFNVWWRRRESNLRAKILKLLNSATL